ncbi:hypothetical protein D3C75_926650 [compost metagenome]
MQFLVVQARRSHVLWPQAGRQPVRQALFLCRTHGLTAWGGIVGAVGERVDRQQRQPGNPLRGVGDHLQGHNRPQRKARQQESRRQRTQQPLGDLLRRGGPGRLNADRGRHRQPVNDRLPEPAVTQRAANQHQRHVGRVERCHHSPQVAVQPPSTISALPVIIPAASEARNTTGPITSSTVPSRPSLMLSST